MFFFNIYIYAIPFNHPNLIYIFFILYSGIVHSYTGCKQCLPSQYHLYSFGEVLIVINKNKKKRVSFYIRKSHCIYIFLKVTKWVNVQESNV